MSGFSNPIIGGGGALVYPGIQSPNFNAANPLASPSPSWGILKNGLAYFFGLTLLGGSFTGNNYILNSKGAFYYSAAPAANVLIESDTNSQGQDDFGNYFLSGLTTYVPAGGGGFIAIQVSAGSIGFWFAANMVSAVNPWTGLGSIAPFNGSPNVLQITAGPNAGDNIALAGPVQVTGGFHYSGPITAYHPGGGTTDESWQTMTLINGWTVGGSGVARYKMLSTGMVKVQCTNLVPGTLTSGTAIWNIPAAYQTTAPATQNFPVTQVSTTAPTSTPFMAVRASTLTVQTLPATTTGISFEFDYSID